MVGQSIGKYRIIDKIGRGGMGTVYRALDETLHRDVAIKVLNAELNDPEVARRFRAEAITIARLSHPGIATIYELFEFEGQWWMVMEYVHGETLENMVARMGPLSAQRGAELCMQTLAALAHAHSMGVVHRDLKPANIMITENGAVKVMDFGIARVSGSEHLTNAGFMMGTPSYMAPEQVRGGEVDARADLYAMGVVFYRLTTAKLPFKGDTAFSMVQSQVNDPPTPVHSIRPDLPNWVEEIVNRALAKSADERFQSAVEFHEAFARCLAGLTLSSMYVQGGDGHLTPSRAMPSGAFIRPGQPPPTPYPAMTGSHPTMRAPGMNPGIVTASSDPTILTPVGSPTIPIDMRTAWDQAHGGTAGHSTGAAVAPAPKKKQNSSLWLGLAGVGIIVASIAAFVMTKGGPDTSNPESSSAAITPTPSPSPTEPSAVQSSDQTGLAATPTPQPSPTSTLAVSPLPSASPSPSPSPASSSTSTSVKPAATPGPRAAGAPGSATGARGITVGTPTPTPTPSPTTPATATGHAVNPAEEVLAAFPNVKRYVVDGKRGVDSDVSLNFVGGQVQVVPKNGGAAVATIPYGKILRATYTENRDPKWDASLPGPPVGFEVGGALRRSRHWFVVQGADSFAVLRLDDGNVKQILQTFEARTAIKIQRVKAQ